MDAAPSGGDLRDWVRREQGPVWRYLRLLGATADEADDLQQEALLTVLERYRDRPAAERGVLLRTVARNLLCDRRRAAQRRKTIRWGDAVDAYLAAHPAELEDRRIADLRACLAALPERSRTALELHHGEGDDLAAVGAQLGLGINGIKALLQRARALLRACVERRQRAEQDR